MQVLRDVMPFVVGVFSMFQPAALQIIFLVTAIVAQVQIRLLQSPRVRSFLRLTPIPSPEALEYGRQLVARHKMDAKDVVARTRAFDERRRRHDRHQHSHQPVYQPPSNPSALAKPAAAAAPLKLGDTVPAHLVPASHKRAAAAKASTEDAHAADPLLRPRPKGVVALLRWYLAVLDPRNLWRYVARWYGSRRDHVAATAQEKAAERRRKKARQKADEYEAAHARKLREGY